MKSFLNRHSGGIRGKIIILILITMLVISAAFFGMAYYQNEVHSRLSAETSQKQLSAISNITNSVMTQIIREDMTRITDLEASLTDNIFWDARSRVNFLVNYASRIFADPDSFTPRPYAGPDASQDGQLVAMVIYADDVDPSSPELQETLGLVANLSGAMISVCDTFESDNFYVALPEGAFLSVSRKPSSWFNPDGSILSYDARSRFWYQQAVEAGKLIFTDVEIDANTGELSLVCARPVYGPDGELRAVVGTDLYLDTMRQDLEAADKDGSFHLVVNRQGHVIASSLEDEELRTRSSEEAPDLRTSENRELAEFIRDALADRTDISLVHLQNNAYYMTSSLVDTVGWAMISASVAEKVTKPAERLGQSYESIEQEASSAYQERNSRQTKIALGILAVILVILSALTLWQGGRIVKPLNKMTERISALSEDHLDFTMEDDYRTGDEIEVLADSFALLSRKTNEYVEQVRTVTAEKERMRADLNTAATIQSSMLPHIFPPFPDRKEFDLYAAMDPAREVGGDFYDYFFVDPDHLCLVMADVSGKGIPAALFMMASKLILQSCAMLSHSVSEILEKANEAICSNNQAEMFVTVWVGILEISTGRLTAANAGHEYPVLKRADGDFELLKDKHGFVIGGMNGVRFKSYELQLNSGDKLFLYTDGVPEATNAENELFGTDRMLAALNTAKDASPEQTLRAVRSAVDDFVKDAEQFDDLTMLCLSYHPDA